MTFSIIFLILVIIGSIILIIYLLKEKDNEKNEKEVSCCKHCICKNGGVKCEDNFLKINNKCYENNCTFIAFYHKDSSDNDSIQFINDIFKDNIEINIIENEEIIKEDSFQSENHISICANLINNITSYESMFENVEYLDLIYFLNIDSKNISKMNKMFKKCDSLTSINLTIFDTSEVTDMTSMFQECRSL